MPRIVGEGRTREWLLTGEPVAAEPAREAGFVSEVVDRDVLDETVEGDVVTFGANGDAEGATG